MKVKVIIIGAGHSGLSASYFLTKSGIDHIVFERGQIGETWRSQRWESFKLNTAWKLNQLPGAAISEQSWSEEYGTAQEFSASLTSYAKQFKLPVKEQATVLSVEKNADDFVVRVQLNTEVRKYTCEHVIIASGEHNVRKVPTFANALPSSVKQLHAIDYRSPKQIKEGNVLVVGSAQSGCQIAEELIESGKRVFLSTSQVARIPRQYRGRDIMDWLMDIGFMNMRASDVPDKNMLHMAAPQLTGAGRIPHTISLQSLAAKGVIVIGKMCDVMRENLLFKSNAAMHVGFADEFSVMAKQMIDGFIRQSGVAASLPELDFDDLPDKTATSVSPITSLHTEKDNIKTIIWTTGSTGDFSYIKLPVFDAGGAPLHENGISPVSGLYFVGLSWLRNRKSSLIAGAKEDAEFIVEKLMEKMIFEAT